jgi:NADH-quinone oxidoreductase subunit N
MNISEHLAQSLNYFVPETILLITFVVAILADLIFKSTRHIAGYISIAGLIGTFFALNAQSGMEGAYFLDMIVVDGFALFFKYIILFSTLIVMIMTLSSKELDENAKSMGEYYSLMTGMTFGMFLLSSAANLILVYLAIEIMSMSSYVLTGYTKQIKRASEASLKYVIFGSLSSGIMIYGISILFGLTGSLDLFTIHEFLSTFSGNNLPLIISGLMITVGFAYKISAVPFHYWTPDVYEGAPVTITAYLSVASKAAGFAALIRFMKLGFGEYNFATEQVWNTFSVVDWKLIIAILSVLTMTVGNFVALWQDNVKRLLAYSSIAHAGYLLMGVVVMTEVGILGILVYFFFYLIMNLGAFYIVMMIHNKINSEELDDYVGLGYQAPALGIMMTIFLVSLTGLPPTAGFIGKLYIFTAVLDAGWIWLAVVGVLNSVVSLFYYAKIFRNMWLRGIDNKKEKFTFSALSNVMVYFLAALTLIFGIYFTPIISWAENSVKIFVGN